MASTTEDGEHKAWERLVSLEPASVCRASVATYDASAGRYTVRSFGADISVSLAGRSVEAVPKAAVERDTEYAALFPLAVLWYLAHAKDIGLSGRLMPPSDLPGADIFSRGSHVLPLEAVAQRYGNDRDGFLRRGLALGGEAVPLSDAAVRLFPVPRVPVTMTLWLKDEEFPARAGILFDSTSSMQLPTDILWALARLSCLVFL